MSVRRLKVHLQPINWIQRIKLYVTNTRYYLVGSNNTQTSFRVLKIDRTEEELSLYDDKFEYTYPEICDLLMRINQGHPITSSKSNVVTKSDSSFGLLGFVKFLHGYYLILIIKRRKVAILGYHTIYKVEDTKLVYIPNQPPKRFVKEEARYLKAFNSIDLSSNFYFSYSYDVSHTIQHNLTPVRTGRLLQSTRDSVSAEEDLNQDPSLENINKSPKILVKNKPNDRFLWNDHLIDMDDLHDDWKLHLIHGFIGQANICVYGRPIYITLIARRSRKYCGTRFLKRGLNLEGDVANEVESEQIVHDSSICDFSIGHYTSFVQMRGSLPDRWSQDITKIVPKPTIIRDFHDPYHEPTAKHFNDLLKRYGTPIVALNLIKQKEVKPHESILSGMYKDSVEFLNQFLPPQHIIRLMNFDMAKCSKSKNENVMRRLAKIGFNIVRCTGIFQSWRSPRRTHYDNTYTMHLRQRTFNRKPSSSQLGGYRLTSGQCVQNGIVRVNCVDSLDRTNTAQFVLGKVALGFQLQALGVLIEPSLEYDTDAVRLLEQLYEDHGDTIALQYGGSQLVHRVKTYRKVAPITSHSSEIMQTLSRYYSNTFSDYEKQNVINLFLGIRKPKPLNLKAILNFPHTDYYIHNPRLLEPFCPSDREVNYKQWWDPNLVKSLPRAFNEFDKDSTCYLLTLRVDSLTTEERTDLFSDAYKPYEITFLDALFHNQILHTVRDFMPNGSTNFSPFCVRLHPGKLNERYLKLRKDNKLPPNPSVYGLPSTSSDASELSILESDLTGDEPRSQLDDLETHPTAISSSLFMMTHSFSRELNNNYTLLRYLSENDAQSSGTDCGQHGMLFEHHIPAEDMNMYTAYADIGKCEEVSSDKPFKPRLWEGSNFELKVLEMDSIEPSVLVDLSTYEVPDADVQIYTNYVSMTQIRQAIGRVG